MIEVLPHVWVRADLIHGWSLDGKSEVHAFFQGGQRSHVFPTAAQALEWVTTLETLYDCFFTAVEDDS